MHLDDNAAIDFVSGGMPPTAFARAEVHLAACRDCRALVAALAADAASDSNLETVPHDKPSPSQVTQRPTKALTVGDKVGRYLVLSALGSGGMGVVFAAYDPQLDRKVALKLLRAGHNYNTRLPAKEARTRLRREAQAIAQLSHPNVVNVYDVGTTDDGDLYIAMELVEGDSLTTWLKKWPRTWQEIVDVFVQAGKGLVAAHGVGLLHRDFKPDNVLVGSDGRVRVTDFGLARSVIAPDEAARPRGGAMTPLNVELTATGTVLGTPRYMAPEQLLGPDIDHRADQFSFCVALYEALYGKHPLEGATSVSMLEHDVKAAPPPDDRKIPVAVARAVMRGLEKDRAKRFPMMSILISELVPQPTRSMGRYAVLGAAGLLLVAAAAMTIVLRPDAGGSPTPFDNKAVIQPLIDRINELNVERNQLLAQLKKLEVVNEETVQKLRVELGRKDRQIQELVDKVTVLTNPEVVRAVPAAPVAPKKPVKAVKPPSQSARVAHAVADAHTDLEGCFLEFTDREPSQTDIDMVVEVTVNATGEGHSGKALAGPDSPALQFCVYNAIERVKYPPGAEQLVLEVGVQWSSGLLNVSPRIKSRQPVRPSGDRIEL